MNGSEVTTFLQDFLNWGNEEAVFRAIVVLVSLVLVCLIVMRVLLRLLDRVTARIDLEASLRHFIRSFVKVLLWIITITLIAGQLGIPITSLVAVLSVAGLAVSLAVQGTLTNLAGGLMLLSSKPFKADDFVEAGANSGTVIEVGLVYTKLKTPDNKVIFVPNSDISSSRIINYSAQETRRVEWTFTAVYEADAALVKGTIEQVALSHPKTMLTPPPLIKISAFKENHVEYIVRIWCATPDYWELYFDLTEQVKGAFDAQGIVMTCPRLNVRMVDEKSATPG